MGRLAEALPHTANSSDFMPLKDVFGTLNFRRFFIANVPKSCSRCMARLWMAVGAI